MDKRNSLGLLVELFNIFLIFISHKILIFIFYSFAHARVMFHGVQRKFFSGRKLQVHTLNSPFQFIITCYESWQDRWKISHLSYSVLFSFQQRGTNAILCLRPLLACLIYFFLRTKEVYFKINLLMFHKEEKEKNRFNK